MLSQKPSASTRLFFVCRCCLSFHRRRYAARKISVRGFGLISENVPPTLSTHESNRESACSTCRPRPGARAPTSRSSCAIPGSSSRTTFARRYVGGGGGFVLSSWSRTKAVCVCLPCVGDYVVRVCLSKPSAGARNTRQTAVVTGCTGTARHDGGEGRNVSPGPCASGVEGTSECGGCKLAPHLQ